METLAFYSYKGGTRRSLLVATAARFLASFGQGVVALDLDFEAPGLHCELGCSVGGEQGRRGGAVPYLLATAQGATSPPPLAEHMVAVPPVPSGSGGWLRLMPAGPAPERAYWADLKQLREQVRLDDASGQGLLPLLDLHARIEEELKPDYLLIDVRAGVTELGGIATTILADTVVCLFVMSRASIEGTLTVIEAMKAAPRFEGRGPIRVVPVRARSSTSVPAEDIRFVIDGTERLGQLGETDDDSVLPPEKVHRLNRLGSDESRAAGALSPLFMAYLKLFQTLFPSVAKRAQAIFEEGTDREKRRA